MDIHIHPQWQGYKRLGVQTLHILDWTWGLKELDLRERLMCMAMLTDISKDVTKGSGQYVCRSIMNKNMYVCL